MNRSERNPKVVCKLAPRGPAVEDVGDAAHAGDTIASLAIGQGASLEIAALAMTSDTVAVKPVSKDTAFDDMTPAAIGGRLRLIREAFGLERSEMADLLDIDRPAWSRFENGQRATPYDKASRIVARFGVSLDFIILGRTAGLSFETLERLRAAGLRV